MHIISHGAAQTVTGSCHILEAGGLKILLDCGFFQGKGVEMSVKNRNFPFDPKEIDFVLLSHAHIDHSGNLPQLVKKGFKGKIFCTHATYELAELLLLDSAAIQMADTDYINQKRAKEGRPFIEPLYNDTDVYECLQYFEVTEYARDIVLNKAVQFSFTNTGHIIGSAAIHVSVYNEKGKKKVFTYTGDIGRYKNRILDFPEDIPQSDFIMLEGTYGDREHDEIDTVEKKLLKYVEETCLIKKGKLIIPAFSVGRTQEIIYVLNNLSETGKLPPIDVFVDSPMAVNATEIMRRHAYLFNPEIRKIMESEDPDPFGFNRLHYIKDVKDSIALNKRTAPCIIISSSGMMEGGRVKHHLKHNIENENNSILITGYCEPSTLGGRIQSGDKQVSIYGRTYDVNANVLTLNALSAHADVNELMEYVTVGDLVKVKKLLLVHGLPQSLLSLKGRCERTGFKDVIVSEPHKAYELA
ncbi:MAG: MBL fold metallo-hydrolase [Chitinophagaceae bacterium]|nr:MAG: MBL fold metallo-hydrolase [Chitinophagaceae bacterium]